MQICEKILNVLRVQRLTVAGHFVAAEADDVGHSLVVGGQSAQRKVFVLEDSLEGRALFAPAGIRLMAAIAVGVVDSAAGRLLRVEAEFGVRFAALNVASGENGERQQDEKGSQEDS